MVLHWGIILRINYNPSAKESYPQSCYYYLFLEPVEVRVIPPSVVTVNEFDTPVRLNCSARGVPIPNITWYKDGVAMPTRTIIIGDEVIGELNLERLRPPEQGDYKCVGATALRSEPFSYTTKIRK